ncbi:hypothetical protein APHWI1_0039 [Anaplasma phagocytophilum str. ApWI1]|uniref:Uncharacterized protein n=1 Tax=Anaplasma phagocytophilum str. ApWI1 TaxID=1359155 RepID=A0A0F3PXT0_ANAPH|nr:hypothetical protein APHWEB_1471 [Anaplasma phagocytophilum str. Webster]KJV83458.1 hypothetical protein APHHGE2_0839 [Anaplasma phagocytophilum str. HGE2]KJV84787.1 hypothetical protein APHWI1_0039 [Anaplasma phagocytophilum str. ApWI1]KJV87632.1 hypothetical protein APHNYW_0571 [Anaplasma phagocytophilum str. ApNYW]KJV99000.1 hypothetical protein OTSANNIE_0808 [Anaplasma phagocytophilum str. Annie]KJZ98014.1 hypothetical protein APHDU1_1359 [Anaplasma phagocytophilum]KJZ98895.1 hypotheti
MQRLWISSFFIVKLRDGYEIILRTLLAEYARYVFLCMIG